MLSTTQLRCSIVLLFLLYTPLAAQETPPSLRWFGDLRVRSEVDMRDFNTRTAANTYTLLRTRVGLEAQPFDNVRVLIQARDSRVFGQERDATGAFSTLADSRNLDLHQGYLEIKKLFWDELTVRLGRQEIVFGNERIVGATGWHNVGRSFDGGLLRIETTPLTLDLLAMNTGEVQAYTPIATPAAAAYTKDLGSDFYGAYAVLKSFPQHKVDLYALHQWDRNTTVPGHSDLARWTFGSYAKGSILPLDYEVELSYQTGSRRGATVAAYLLTGMVGYTFTESVLSRLAIGYDLLSGTPVGETRYKSFDPMYHTGHKFYGFMDYFINIPVNTGERGLADLIIRATLQPTQSVTVNLWLHDFSFAQAVGGEKHLGQELDVVAAYRYNKNVSFELGISAFVPDHLMRQRFNAASTSFWGYLTTMVTF